MTTDKQDPRAAFEAWYADEAGWPMTQAAITKLRDKDGYRDGRQLALNRNWGTWQASREQALSEAAMRATGYVTGCEAAVAIKEMNDHTTRSRTAVVCIYQDTNHRD